ATYVAFIVDKMANLGSVITSWMSDRGAFRETFARQAIPMVWDFAEANSFSPTGASYDTLLDKVSKAVGTAPAMGHSGIFNRSAERNSYPVRGSVFNTDPPYYDNIGYSDLSDFFYVWLRISLRPIYSNLFRRVLTPKDSELVATPYRHNVKDAAEAFF